MTGSFSMYTASLICLLLQLAPPPTSRAVETEAPGKSTLEELVKDWDRFELPKPPDKVDLAVYEMEGLISYGNGEEYTTCSLVLLLPPDANGHRSPISAMGTPVSTKPNESIRPISASVVELPPQRRMAPLDLSFEPNDGLAMAIICARHGWNDVANELLLRGIETENRGFGAGLHRLENVNPREALARLAWRYWNGQLGDPKIDRAYICDRLESILKAPVGLNTPPNAAFLRSLKNSLRNSTAKDDPFEFLIENLLDFKSSPDNQLGGFSKNSSDPARYDPNYFRLWTAGFDAVPALMNHLSDLRVTRAEFIYMNGPAVPAKYYRIADVISDILMGLSAEDLKRTRHLTEDDVWTVDPDAATRWWSSVRSKGEEAYLMSTAIPAARPLPDQRFRPRPPANMSPEMQKHFEDVERRQEMTARSIQRDSCRAIDHIVQVIAVKYPKRLPGLYDSAVIGCPETDNWLLAELLAKSSLPADLKHPPLVRVATEGAPGPRRAAVSALLKSNHPMAPRFLSDALETIPRTREEPWPVRTAYSWSRLVAQTDDALPWHRLAEIAHKCDPAQRVEIIRSVSCCGAGADHTEKVIAFLRQFLDDASVPEPSAEDRPFNAHSSPVSVRNSAAGALGDKLGIADCQTRPASEDEWISLRSRVKEAISKMDADAKN